MTRHIRRQSRTAEAAEQTSTMKMITTMTPEDVIKASEEVDKLEKIKAVDQNMTKHIRNLIAKLNEQNLIINV